MVIHNIPQSDLILADLLRQYAIFFNKKRKIENELWKIERLIEKQNSSVGKSSKLKEELLSKKDEKGKELASIRKELRSIKIELGKKEGSLDKYITIGSPPNNTVHLPIVDKAQNSESSRGLDLEGMLKGMVKVIQNQRRYDLYRNNCSAAVATVIYGGIPESEKTLREKFKAEGFLRISTPQTVYDAAIKGQHYLYSAHLKKSSKNILESFVEFLKKMVGAYKQKPKYKK